MPLAEREARRRILIARGVDLPEQIIVGDRATADLIVTISHDGDVVEHLGGYDATFVDIDPAECVLVECCERILIAWKEAYPQDRHGHCAVGTWLFYWRSADTGGALLLARQGRSDLLRASADDYISSGFGFEHGPSDLVVVVDE